MFKWMLSLSLICIVFQRPIRNIWLADIMGNGMDLIEGLCLPFYWIFWLCYNEKIFDWKIDSSILTAVGFLIGFSTNILMGLYCVILLIDYSVHKKLKLNPMTWGP